MYKVDMFFLKKETKGRDFIPTNRQVILEKLPEEKEKKSKSDILIPEECKEKSTELFAFYKVKAIAIDCLMKTLKDKIVLVDVRAIERISIGEDEILLILETHVRGMFLGM